MAILKTEDFALEIKCLESTDEIDICDYMSIEVRYNYRYFGAVQFYCRRNVRSSFIFNLSRLYETLNSGSAKLFEEFEADSNFILFESDGMGHFTVKGVLNDWDNYWSIKFNEYIDQTYLGNFVKQLKEELQ